MPARLVVKGVSEGVSEGVNILFDYIKRNSGKRVPQISKDLKVPPKTLERWLRQLRKQGEIDFKGSSKTGGYIALNEKNKN